MLQDLLIKLWFVLLILGVSLGPTTPLLAEEGKAAKEADRFPFPVKVDSEAGQTDGLPNRVQNPSSGMWYALVPVGTYTIGSDQIWDSKKIQIQLSPYYISETCVTRAQLGQGLLKNLLQEEWFDEEMRTLIRRLPEEQQDDFRLLDFMFTFDTERSYWGDLLDLNEELASAFKDTYDKFFTEPEDSAKYEEGEERTLEEDIKSIRLTSRQRQTLTKVKEVLTAKLKHLPQGQAPYVRASYRNAVSYAEWQGVNLPTEAQWEVAARLSSAGKLNVDSMVGNSREYCSDSYTYDYFQRKKHFKDPTGPRRGKLSDEQLERETQVSSLKVITQIVALNTVVIRGESISKREYSLAHSNSNKSRRIRLVINPN
ncbi:Formylglycine-generating sulfatase enzyme [Gimesia maris]|uniref:SUMF1/EgtB/PvdO family nonheme iron enzyme n=1 Tax=Gimesia maris TaxID=122 RepID=UPI001188F54B|nr:SUMF1/EgtB/PvdO family nonheme iron enzyme [Gimesia maris]QDT81054.1 Formylglycine-generating sulfatase enzyme [Gimesia maris]